jgi:hypothetical protein
MLCGLLSMKRKLFWLSSALEYQTPDSHFTGVNPLKMFPFVSKITVSVFVWPSHRPWNFFPLKPSRLSCHRIMKCLLRKTPNDLSFQIGNFSSQFVESCCATGSPQTPQFAFSESKSWREKERPGRGYGLLAGITNFPCIDMKNWRETELDIHKQCRTIDCTHRDTDGKHWLLWEQFETSRKDFTLWDVISEMKSVQVADKRLGDLDKTRYVSVRV